MIENRPKILNLINKLNKNKVDKNVYNNLSAKVDNNTSAIDEIANNEVRAELVKQTTEQTINQYIEDGTIANLTLEDNSIETVKYKDESVTEEKIDKNLINELRELRYIYDEEGNKYTIIIDKDGNMVKNRIYEIPTLDLKVINGLCVDSVSGKIFENFTVNENNTFCGDAAKYGTHGGTNLISKSLTNRSIVCIIDTSEIADSLSRVLSSFLMGDNWGYYGIEFIPYIIGTEKQFYFRDLGGIFSDSYSYFNSVNNFALLGTKNPNYTYDKTNIFMAESYDYDNKYVIQSSFGGFSEHKITRSLAERTEIFFLRPQDTKVKIKRLLIFDRAISKEEIILIQNILTGQYNKIVNSSTWINGIEGLGTSTAFISGSAILGYSPKMIDTKTELGNVSMELNGENKEWNNLAWQEPVVEETQTKFTDIFFTNPIEQLELSKKYKIEAFPYPYKINDSEYTYNIEYSSSNNGICLCYNGLLIPKAIGNVIITAKISNTNISKQIEIQIVSNKIIEPNYMYIDENYSNEYGTLKSKNPIQLLKMIFKCIDSAKELGFNGIVFPKMDYYVKPYQTGTLYYVPSDMVIDFNNSNFYVLDNDYCKVNKEDKTQKSYTMFAFGKSNWGDQKDGLYKQCENSIVKNLNYYGERYDTTFSNANYSEFVNAFHFGAGGTNNCYIENIRFDSTIGFNISTGHNGFQVWQGTSEDGAARGCVLTKDLSPGRLNELGTEIISDETNMWYCTPNLIKLGYNYSDNPVTYVDMKYYTLGAMGQATRPGSSGFWYDIYFYDEEQTLIEYRPYQMALEKYILPEKAVYFKINSALWGNTGNQSQVDVPHVQRLWNEGAPYMCGVKNCQFINPHASAISVTGGDSFIIENCYAEQGVTFSNPSGAVFGWSIDFEDGWLNMRHCIVYKTLCSGSILNPGGYDTTYINNVISTLRSSGSAQENINVINCFVNTLDCKSKINDYFNNVSYKTKFTTAISSDVTYATIRTINCNKIDDIKLFDN